MIWDKVTQKLYVWLLLLSASKLNMFLVFIDLPINVHEESLLHGSSVAHEDLSTASSNEDIVSNEEYNLFPQLGPMQDIDFDIPNIADLPTEDFVEIENYLSELQDTTATKTESICDVDVEDTLQLLNDSSSQSSPEMDMTTHMEYKELLDSLKSDELLESLLESSSSETNFGIKETANSDLDSIISGDNSALTQDAIISSLLDLSSYVANHSNDLTDLSAFTKVPEVGEKRKLYCASDKKLENSAKKCKTNDHVFDDVPSPASSVSTNFSEIYQIPEADKDTLRRIKNNKASKLTRAKRKAKHSKLFEKAAELEKSNAELRIKIETMQKEAGILRKVLITKLSSVNKAD